ncbi:MAG: hypothetical protein A2233_03250 [Candidatus Kerfeldbacteria bacterium RIFOXYA2_FULL_38_24]|uniref:RND efflux pump membrane fusion protein barrel-sandwich domain-containing protein n=1 Tax=Candidatus Kerfeldbacteria bacterium RIFOXYB2_FULL_38_14 TaxID=1798547 RepID=A0A1G2BCI9_9BACT|nr:MAG: hypothetical protein A2233_03250 [Candidatus Kerfeldbacteria bacterium RIFOXYA2_FULL_38_24]OGY86436.1 MAG: hypothetical protein A2319_01290 [Candidatus Kerfeldbacteria bacterium RIFOXYB2_FULL_38_14]OGY88424.1 MAG: hypothetical protein A2458_03050 [Candidatus Kerfeldbacteria bacterium RIFOXYC2_FULL_38_9]
MSTFIPKPKKKRFYKRWWFWLLVVVFLLVLVGLAVGQSVMKQQRLNKYNYLKDAVTVSKTTIEKTIATNAVMTADETTSLYLSAPAKIKELPVSVGEEVNKDEVLLKTDLETLKAPFDGRVLEINTHVDDLNMAAQPLIVLGYRSSHLEFFASDAEVLELVVGQTAHITVPSFNNGKDAYSGEVVFVDTKKFADPSALGSGGNSGYRVKITSGDMPEALTKIIGLSADVEIVTDQKTNILALPSGVVQTDDNNNEFVYLAPTVDEDFITKAEQTGKVTDVLTSKDITTGFVGDEYTEITSGLKEDEKVLLYFEPQNSTTPF